MILFDGNVSTMNFLFETDQMEIISPELHAGATSDVACVIVLSKYKMLTFDYLVANMEALSRH